MIFITENGVSVPGGCRGLLLLDSGGLPLDSAGHRTCTGKACRTVTGQATGHFHRTPTGQSFSLSASLVPGACEWHASAAVTLSR